MNRAIVCGLRGVPPDLATVFEALPNALMVLDRELVYVAANAAYLEVTGATREQLLGTHVFASFPDDTNSALLRASFERVLRTGVVDEIAAIRYRVARVAGGPLEDRVWSARHTPLLDDAGQTAFIIQETADITHMESLVLERAERAHSTASNLDDQLRAMRQMWEQAPGFMAFLRGPAHVFETVNASYRQLVGHRDVIGMRVADAIPRSWTRASSRCSTTCSRPARRSSAPTSRSSSSARPAARSSCASST